MLTCSYAIVILFLALLTNTVTIIKKIFSCFEYIWTLCAVFFIIRIEFITSYCFFWWAIYYCLQLYLFTFFLLLWTSWLKHLLLLRIFTLFFATVFAAFEQRASLTILRKLYWKQQGISTHIIVRKRKIKAKMTQTS